VLSLGEPKQADRQTGLVSIMAAINRESKFFPVVRFISKPFNFFGK
jgi:hypothetical protein